jgi:hypothetical protein
VKGAWKLQRPRIGKSSESMTQLWIGMIHGSILDRLAPSALSGLAQPAQHVQSMSH